MIDRAKMAAGLHRVQYQSVVLSAALRLLLFRFLNAAQVSLNGTFSYFVCSRFECVRTDGRFYGQILSLIQYQEVSHKQEDETQQMKGF